MEWKIEKNDGDVDSSDSQEFVTIIEIRCFFEIETNLVIMITVVTNSHLQRAKYCPIFSHRC
jgi:hypothetical protein